jgi:hypothetical protein
MPTSPNRSARVLESPVLKTFLLSLMVLLLLAFWLLCSHQVRQYESRRLVQQVQLKAFGDCLQYVVDSTIASCTNRLGRQAPGLAKPNGGLPNALPLPPSAVGQHAPSAVAQTLRVVAVPRPPMDTR